MKKKTCGAARIEPRKTPQQDRSIQRVEDILAAAVKLVSTGGLASMTMTAIAREAGVPIGSVYQYFPEQSAVLKALFDRVTTDVYIKAADMFAVVNSLDHAMDLAGEIIDWYYAELGNNPVLIDIMLGTEANKEIAALKIAGISRFSNIFAEAVAPFLPPSPGIDLEARFFMFSHLIGSVVHLAVMTDEQTAQRLLAEWKNVIRRALFAPPVTSPSEFAQTGHVPGVESP